MNYGDCINFLKDNMKDPKEISILKKIEIKFGPEAVIGALTNGKNLVFENNVYKYLIKGDLAKCTLNFNINEYQEVDQAIKHNSYLGLMGWMDKFDLVNARRIFENGKNIHILLLKLYVENDQVRNDGITNFNITTRDWTEDEPDYYSAVEGLWTLPIYPWGKQLVAGMNKSWKNDTKRYKDFLSLVNVNCGICQSGSEVIQKPFRLDQKKNINNYIFCFVFQRMKTNDSHYYYLSVCILYDDPITGKISIEDMMIKQKYYTSRYLEALEIYWEWIKIRNGYNTLVDWNNHTVRTIRYKIDNEKIELLKPFFSKIQMEF